MVKEQARILQTDQEKALAALPKLLKKASDKKKAIEIAKEMIGTDEKMTTREKALLDKIQAILS